MKSYENVKIMSNKTLNIINSNYIYNNKYKTIILYMKQNYKHRIIKLFCLAQIEIIRHKTFLMNNYKCL